MSQINRGNREPRGVTLRIRIRKPAIAATGRRLFTIATVPVRLIQRSRYRWHILAAIFVLVVGNVYSLLQPFFEDDAYALDPASTALLPEASPFVAEKIDHKIGGGTFDFNPADDSPAGDLLGKPNYSSASLSQDPKKGVTVTDPTNKIDFTMTPQFSLKEGRKTEDKVVYPLADGSGWLVYTLRGNGVKEDIILNYARGDTVSYSYKLGLGDNLRAKLEKDGSLGVYGNTLLSGNVTAGTEKDAELLQKARKNAQKNTLLFKIPAPVVLDKYGVANGITSKYILDGDSLTVTTTGLKKGNYPLTIDPSIYVMTAQQFMQGNNETNVDFDVDNKLIKKGRTTGARFNSWNNTTSLPSGVTGGASVPAGGFVYHVGGIDSGGTSSAVNWAQLNTTTGSIDSANPGTGTCSGWCSSSAYNLPDGRAHFSMVAYNGYLYAIGGTSANCTTGNGNGNSGYCNTVYIAKLGANGEPRLWHPTDADQANWVYWHRDTDLPTERAYTGAAVYDNQLYLAGGQTSSGTSTAVSIAPITPTGTLGTWASSGNTVPSANAYSPGVETYNGYLYVIGGSSSPTAAPTNTTRYASINANGTINSWQQTKSFATGRVSGGSKITSTWGGYLYLSGGCSAVNGSGYCTTAQADTQVASINADGSLDTWYVMPGVTDSRFGHSIIAWRNTIYEIGGCSAQDPSSGVCTTTLSSTRYGNVNNEGDVSTISNSAASGVAPCVDGPPYGCNLPSASVGNVLNAVAVLNGYLYIMGGCTNDACTTTSTGVTYQSISSDGTLQRPSTCSGSFVDSYCVSSVVLPAGLAAAGVAVSNDRIYLVGGFGTGTNIYHTTTSGDGSISAWSTTSLATASSSAVTTLTYAYAYIRSNPTAASTNPANLYIIGGCTDGSVTCSNYSQAVLKCNLNTTGAPSGCSTSGQLQIGAIPNSCGTGLGAMSGAVYANYIYLIGGLTTSCSNLKTTRYAKFDNSNNIVAVSGGAWTESDSLMNTGRQRSAGFGYNGYLYVVGGYDETGGEVLNDIEFAKINVSDGSLDAWSTSSITISQRWGLNVPVSNSYAYVVGGCTTGIAPSSCSGRTNMVQTFQLYNNNSGAPASYSTSANTFSTDPNRLGMSTAVLNGHIYVAGGCTSTTDYCTSLTGDVSYAAIDSYGNVGSWSSATGSLPESRAWGKLRAAGGTLYYVGGENSSAVAQTAVYYATPSAGNVSSWSTASNGLPNARSDFGLAVWNDRLYAVGGKGSGTGCASGVCNTVYVSPSLASGGNITSGWSTASTSFNVARSGLSAVAYANNLYVFGGYDGGNYLSDSQYSQINTSNGTAGSWSYSESMPQPLSQGDSFAVNGYVYLVGGRSGHNTCEPTTLVAPISANTTVASGNNPTGIGTWFETNQKYSGSRFGNGAVYAAGKIYAIGGMNCTGGTAYTAAGSYEYTVPAGVTSITTKLWGAGGGGGAGASVAGPAGGGSGFVQATFATTPGETLALTVGAGGGGGANSGSAPAGGAGGGYTSIFKSTTPYIISAGGGGGSGSRGTTPSGAGGAGGCTSSGTSCKGGDSAARIGGGGGSSTEGGLASTGTGCNGQNGSSLTGGEGGTLNGASCATGRLFSSGGIAGNPGGAEGGAGIFAFPSNSYGGGGGGGGGYFGGAGGSASPNNGGGSGGGGGGSYVINTATDVTTSIANSQTAANGSDPLRGTAGNGGNGGATSSGAGSTGNAGLIIIITPNSISPITPVVQQTAVLSQAQISQYSIMLDTDTDVYPTKWLLNGLDNSIGSSWRLSYKSMTNPTANKAGNGVGMDCSSAQMTNWGQTTNHGNVALGAPGLYTPLDASGVDSNCARYFYLNVSISAQETFGYPDDVSRGPTISDLTVNFTADPSKRLMHGRTFIGGLQMPLDTPQ